MKQSPKFESTLSEQTSSGTNKYKGGVAWLRISRHDLLSWNKKDIQGRRYIGITLSECLGLTVARTLAYSRGLIFITIIFPCRRLCWVFSNVVYDQVCFYKVDLYRWVHFKVSSMIRRRSLIWWNPFLLMLTGLKERRKLSRQP